MKNILTAAAIGALGGRLIAPENQERSSTLQGALWGGLAGGGTGRIIAKLKNKPFKNTSIGESAKDALMMTGLTAALNKMTGAYDPNKKSNKIVTTLGPAVDDAAMIGLALAKGVR